MNLSDIMTTDLVTCNTDDTLAQVALKMHSEDIGCCPVVEGQMLIGVITDRDITVRSVAKGFNPAEQQVKDAMTSNVISADPSMSLEDACQLMAENQIRRLPVVERNRLVGMVSLADLAIDIDEEEMVAETLVKISEPSHQP